jgi:NitT/TauT family transport system substrate-binding protein
MHSSSSRARRVALTAVIAVVLAGLSGCALASTRTEVITIGSAPLESSALIYIAESRGFFTRNGLDVTVKTYETGAAAHNALLQNEVDIAVPAEYPLVSSAFAKQGVSAIASIDEADYFFLVARTDRGIRSIKDLAGKRVGLVRKTIAEFYFGRLLVLNGVDMQTITVVDMTYPQSQEAITSGTVDAVVSRPPYVMAIKDRLGASAVTWQAQSSQSLYAILIARNDWIADHTGAVTRLLNSLLKAEEWAVGHPAESRTIVQERLGVDAAYMETVWSQNQFSVSLDQSLITALEDEARWMIKSGLTPEKEVPDFVQYIYADALSAVKPVAVNIIR